MNVQKKKINLQMNCWVFLLLWMEKDQWKTKKQKNKLPNWNSSKTHVLGVKKKKKKTHLRKCSSPASSYCPHMWQVLDVVVRNPKISARAFSFLVLTLRTPPKGHCQAQVLKHIDKRECPRTILSSPGQQVLTALHLLTAHSRWGRPLSWGPCRARAGQP